jgi:hypothetical protein
VQDGLVRSGKQLAREAVRKPGKENALREESGKLSIRPILESMAMRGVMTFPSLMHSAGSEDLVGAATLVGTSGLGALGSGYLDKYRRMIALNELENQRAAESVRDAERLSRLRRQVNVLEDRVEGGGWKKPREVEEPEPTPANPSGKKW